MERSSSLHRLEHGVTPTEETQAMSMAQRLRIEATAQAPASRDIAADDSEPPKEIIEFGFEELSDGKQTPQTISDTRPPRNSDKTSAGHKRARAIVLPATPQETITPLPRTPERRESSAVEQEIILNSLERVLGAKLDLVIAFRLLTRARDEMPSDFDELHTIAIARVTTELERVQEAAMTGIEMPYTVTQLQKALDYLAQMR